MTIAYKRGEFQFFRAKTKIHLGKIERDVQEGEEIGFDGQTVDLGGEKFVIPVIRAAIAKGLFVPVADTVEAYVPPTAEIILHNPENAKERLAQVQTVVEDDLVVSSLADANLGQRGGQLVNTSAPVTTPQPEHPTFADQGHVVASVISTDQEGVPVAQIKSKLVTSPKVTNKTNVGEEIRKLEKPVRLAQQTKKPTSVSKEAAKKPAVVENVDVGDGVQWDLGLAWQTKVRLVDTQFRDKPKVLRGILAVETATGVKNRIQKILENAPPE